MKYCFCLLSQSDYISFSGLPKYPQQLTSPTFRLILIFECSNNLVLGLLPWSRSDFNHEVHKKNDCLVELKKPSHKKLTYTKTNQQNPHPNNPTNSHSL